MRIIITGGGTGGHIFPAIAIANELKRQQSDVNILFVSGVREMEAKLVADAGYMTKTIMIHGLQRQLSCKNLISNLKLPFIYWRSLRIAKQILSDFQPDVVVGTGGYVSAPIVKTATQKGILTLIDEQNSYPGITNKMLSRSVNRICVAYDGLERFFPKEKIVKTGNPVRKDIIDIPARKEEALHHFGLEAGRKTIAIMGGSLGAKSINEAIKNCLQELISNDIQLIWQTGEAYYSQLDEIITHQPSICVLPFVKRMDLLYAAADVVVSRAGALSISELCIVGKPCILVPSPNVAEDHQTKNARAIADLGGAVLIADAEVYTQLKPELLELLSNPQKMDSMRCRLQQAALPDAAEKIVEEIIQLAHS